MPGMQKLRIAAFSTAVATLVAMSGSAFAQKKYDTGASDTEIKIGNIMPYSGPASAYGIIGKDHVVAGARDASQQAVVGGDPSRGH